MRGTTREQTPYSLPCASSAFIEIRDRPISNPRLYSLKRHSGKTFALQNSKERLMIDLKDVKIERPLAILLLKNAPRFKAMRAFVNILTPDPATGLAAGSSAYTAISESWAPKSWHEAKPDDPRTERRSPSIQRDRRPRSRRRHS